MIKYSRQRESIVNFLASRTDHPTAETIYQNIKKEFPNISLDRKSTRLNSSHPTTSRMPSSA